MIHTVSLNQVSKFKAVKPEKQRLIDYIAEYGIAPIEVISRTYPTIYKVAIFKEHIYFRVWTYDRDIRRYSVSLEYEITKESAKEACVIPKSFK